MSYRSFRDERRRWSGVEGTCSIDLEFAELVLEFESSGYYEPARLYGPPEKCSPEEGEDERTVTAAYLEFGSGDDAIRTYLHKSVFADLAEHFREEIQAVELQSDDDAEADGDYRYEMARDRRDERD